EIDLVLELGGKHVCWAREIKRGLSAKPERGFYHAMDDLKPVRAFVVNSGDERYPLRQDIEVIGLFDMARELAAIHDL
ncbi:MAG: hypothetical protein Q9M23_03660, partial [Mariprofundaceae bacterium]|nr:hypothetical protein [Mariprofundaceae bacterium]